MESFHKRLITGIIVYIVILIGVSIAFVYGVHQGAQYIRNNGLEVAAHRIWKGTQK